MTNFEHIKQMSVKELARLLGSIHSDFDDNIRTIDDNNILDSFDDIEEWLESEVKNTEFREYIPVMREATIYETSSINNYINSISKDTGVRFYE